MTRDDVKKLIAVMSGVYPNYAPKNLPLTVDVLYKVYEKFDYSVIEKALADYISTDKSGFAPVPGQLVELAYKNDLDKDAMTAQEAWDRVLKALSRSAYYFDEEFKKLPEIVQKCIGSPYRLHQMAIDENFNPGVEYSHFARTFNELSAKDRENKKMALIEEVNDDTKRLADLVKDTAMALPGRLPQ